mmetsp:Transcript_120384/g.384317  ORF Transcript_120384/g.384317 Transcript_120384/m.384317 type:complete len:319 (-) Transcript_120384:62-1018(-)
MRTRATRATTPWVRARPRVVITRRTCRSMQVITKSTWARAARVARVAARAATTRSTSSSLPQTTSSTSRKILPRSTASSRPRWFLPLLQIARRRISSKPGAMARRTRSSSGCLRHFNSLPSRRSRTSTRRVLPASRQPAKTSPQLRTIATLRMMPRARCPLTTSRVASPWWRTASLLSRMPSPSPTSRVTHPDWRMASLPTATWVSPMAASNPWSESCGTPSLSRFSTLRPKAPQRTVAEPGLSWRFSCPSASSCLLASSSSPSACRFGSCMPKKMSAHRSCTWTPCLELTMLACWSARNYTQVSALYLVRHLSGSSA